MEPCDSLVRITLDSLLTNVSSVKELVQPSVWQNILDALCALSFVFSACAIIGVVLIEKKIKWMKRAKEFTKKCGEYGKLLNRQNVASDLPAKIKGTLETFKSEVPYQCWLKRLFLRRKIKSLDKSGCDLKLLLKSVQIEFKNYV